MTALTELLERTRIKKADAIRRAEEDHEFDRATFYRYANGELPKRPKERILRALAAGYRLPITEVREAAGVQVGELGPYQPPAYADRLTRDQRKALDELIRTIVKEVGEGHDRPAPNTAGESDTPKQADKKPVVEATGSKTLTTRPQGRQGRGARSADRALGSGRPDAESK